MHCDVSPSNVFVSRLGEIKLGDFGVALGPGARAVGAGPARSGRSHYLAPGADPRRAATPRTDIFALGAMLFELLTNAPAFPGSDVNEVGQRILAGKLRAPSELRAGAAVRARRPRAALPRADPDERFPSAAAFARRARGALRSGHRNDLAIAALVRGLFGTR